MQLESMMRDTLGIDKDEQVDEEPELVDEVEEDEDDEDEEDEDEDEEDEEEEEEEEEDVHCQAISKKVTDKILHYG